jgi:hypothetical protein
MISYQFRSLSRISRVFPTVGKAIFNRNNRPSAESCNYPLHFKTPDIKTIVMLFSAKSLGQILVFVANKPQRSFVDSMISPHECQSRQLIISTFSIIKTRQLKFNVGNAHGWHFFCSTLPPISDKHSSNFASLV